MPDLVLEKAHLSAAIGPVIGIDEAGRGPWAGPVTASAVWLNPDFYTALPRGLDDSKKLTASARNRILSELQAGPHAFSVVSAPVEMIDREGILQATFWAMAKAAERLQRILIDRGAGSIGLCLIDGNLTPEIGMPARAIIKGDSLCCSIAAASVIAKETRDAIMLDLAGEDDLYSWKSNKGYGTRDHSAALTRHGVSVHHRRSFAPIRRLLEI